MYKWFTIIIISSREIQNGKKKLQMAIVTINDMKI